MIASVAKKVHSKLTNEVLLEGGKTLRLFCVQGLLLSGIGGP